MKEILFNIISGEEDILKQENEMQRKLSYWLASH